MRKSQASANSKPTPKQYPRLAAMTGLRQRAGAAMFQARRETCSGEASRKPEISPPLEKCSPAARSTTTCMPGISIERLEHRAQFLALGHRNDVERWPVEDHVGALPLGIQLQAEAFEAFGEPWHQPRRIAHAIPSGTRRRRAGGARSCRPAIWGFRRQLGQG